MLSWSQNKRVIGFRNDYRLYEGDVFKAGKPAHLPRAPKNLSSARYTLEGKTYSLTDYINRNDVTAMMIIKDGKIVFDHYGHGNTAETLWTSRSVGKSVVSTLVGIALKEGKIRSLDDAVVSYAPKYRGSAWEHVTIRQLLQHVSGVAWSEDYTDPSSDFAQLTLCESRPGTYDCVDKLVRSPSRKSVMMLAPTASMQRLRIGANSASSS